MKHLDAIPIANRSLKKFILFSAVVLKSVLSRYQVRKHLSHLLHVKQLEASDKDRWSQECVALLLHVWRKEPEVMLLKTTAASKTPKIPPRGNPRTRATKHSVLQQIYGNSPFAPPFFFKRPGDGGDREKERWRLGGGGLSIQ